MKTVGMRYGNRTLDVTIPQKNLLGIIENLQPDKKITEADVILQALENPIGSSTLQSLLHPGEKVCVIFSDITRAWQKTSTYMPYVIDQLTRAGIRDEDILLICGIGSHRKQKREEYDILLGKELASRFEIMDHDCFDTSNLVQLGTTSYGTPVSVNKRAMNCDHIIVTGGIVFHLLAGWGGGKKSILPGISSYETIMANHALSLNTTLGEGSNTLVRSGNYDTNPLNLDMLEASSLVSPSFMFNVIIGADGKIRHAVAGDFIKAHEAGCQIVDHMDGVFIDEKADLVIATAEGFPKDINLYQTSKTLINAKQATKDGGTIILISQCGEGFGNDHVQEIIQNYDTILERETALRNDYSIAKYIGYFICEDAAKFDVILVSEMDPSLLKNANIRIVKTIEEALSLTYKEKGMDLSTYLMPYGATTFPKIKA